MQKDSLRQLYVAELKDLYSAETQLVKALPKMAKASSNSQLRQAFENHLRETSEQVSRLEQIFDMLGEKPVVSAEALEKGSFPGVACAPRAELASCGTVGTDLHSSSGSDFRLRTAWCGCEDESGFQNGNPRLTKS